jgi:hypothetical protein
VGVGVGVGVGDSAGVGVGVAAGVLVTSLVALGDGVPVCVGVALGLKVTLGAAVALGVGMLVDEVTVGYDLRVRRARPQASKEARRAMAPAPVKKRRRLRLRRGVSDGGNKLLSVIPSIIDTGRGNVKCAHQTPRRRFPYADHEGRGVLFTGNQVQSTAQAREVVTLAGESLQSFLFDLGVEEAGYHGIFIVSQIKLKSPDGCL